MAELQSMSREPLESPKEPSADANPGNSGEVETDQAELAKLMQLQYEHHANEAKRCDEILKTAGLVDRSTGYVDRFTTPPHQVTSSIC